MTLQVLVYWLAIKSMVACVQAESALACRNNAWLQILTAHCSSGPNRLAGHFLWLEAAWLWSQISLGDRCSRQPLQWGCCLCWHILLAKQNHLKPFMPPPSLRNCAGNSTACSTFNMLRHVNSPFHNSVLFTLQISAATASL